MYLYYVSYINLFLFFMDGNFHIYIWYTKSYHCSGLDTYFFSHFHVYIINIQFIHLLKTLLLIAYT